MKKTEVIQWLFGEIETVLGNTTAVSVTTPSEHVDIGERHDGQTYPFVGVVPITDVPQSAGLGNGSASLVDTTTDANGTLTHVTYEQRREFRVEVAPRTEADAAAADGLETDLGLYFDTVGKNTPDGSGTPDDISEVTVEDTTPQNRPDDFVTGSGIELRVRYDTTRRESADAAESVNLSVTSQ